MKKKPEKSEALYELMIDKGYPEEFSRLISSEMRTKYTSQRMMAYISRVGLRPAEEVADEMISIASERDRLRDKHIAEYAQQKINNYYRENKE